MKGNEYFSKKEMKFLCKRFGKRAVKFVVKENRRLDEECKTDISLSPEIKLLHVIFDE